MGGSAFFFEILLQRLPSELMAMEGKTSRPKARPRQGSGLLRLSSSCPGSKGCALVEYSSVREAAAADRQKLYVPEPSRTHSFAGS